MFCPHMTYLADESPNFKGCICTIKNSLYLQITVVRTLTNNSKHLSELLRFEVLAHLYPLRKHAYSNILKLLQPKKKKSKQIFR